MKNSGGRSCSTVAATPHRSRSHALIAPVTQRCASPAPEKSAGFGGLSDPYAGHYFGASEQVGNEGKKMLQDRQGLAATKAATAMSFSKSLGLRSG